MFNSVVNKTLETGFRLPFMWQRAQSLIMQCAQCSITRVQRSRTSHVVVVAFAFGAVHAVLYLEARYKKTITTGVKCL